MCIRDRARSHLCKGPIKIKDIYEMEPFREKVVTCSMSKADIEQDVYKRQVQSYTAMRKFSIGRDENDIVRLELNNEPLFQFGPLDQGWWPDGLLSLIHI